MGFLQTAPKLDSLISSATLQNWKKFNKTSQNRLTSRANKKLSQKNIIPIEYLCNKDNLNQIKRIIEYIVSKNYRTWDCIFSLAKNLLYKAGIIECVHIRNVLKEYPFQSLDDLINLSLPKGEIDLLGLIYQCLLCEGEKNIKGSYYTPHIIAKEMTKNFDFNNGETFLDPSCGSGAFMLALQNATPQQIFGTDNDEIACFIAKINLLLKFSNIAFEPQIYCCDYLNSSKTINKKFNYIITNPPWGVDKMKSKERFSLFFIKAYGELKDAGVMRFLLPISMLNVKAHKDLRKFILDNGSLQSITHYTNIFSGVTTKIIDITHKNSVSTNNVLVKKGDLELFVPTKAFRQTNNYIFNALGEEDLNIIEKVKSYGVYDLKESNWGLGIVTGDNKNQLKTQYLNGYEKIYTGKEIMPYCLKAAKNFILYDRKKFQQVAPDEIYRADEKLVYKFISNRLIFAYDNSKALFLNSANILIPRIPNMSIVTALGFLNSSLYQYLYQILFGEIKILRGNLEELPFPRLTATQDNQIALLVGKIINGNNELIPVLECKIYEIFAIDKKLIKYIEGVLNGKTRK